MDWVERRVLVTGATGFIGQHLTHGLIDRGAQVWAGVFPGEAEERIDALPKGATRAPLDVQDASGVLRVVKQCQPHVVFHLAAVGVVGAGTDALMLLDVNTGGTIRLLQAVQNDIPIERAILVGTCHEYGAQETIEGFDPFNLYAASKVASWAFARAYWRSLGLPVVVARLFQVYGPGQAAESLLPSAIDAALNGQSFAMTPGEQERDFIYVQDVVDGLLALASAPNIDGQSIDLGTGQARSVREVVDLVWRMTRASGTIQAGALSYRPGIAMHMVADAERTARLTGWRARISLEEGLGYTIEHKRACPIQEVAPESPARH